MPEKLPKCLLILAAVAIGGLIGQSPALGDAATDIQVFVSNNKLATGLPKYAGTFEPVSFATDAPGFTGSLPLGEQYGVQMSQKLWYHSGIVGDPVTPVRGDVFVTVSDPVSSLIVTGSSGMQSGLILAESLSESLHSHLDFLLSTNSGSTAPDGVYGLVMQINSPSYQTSDQFLLTIANIANGSIDLEGIEYGEQAIFNAAVPEPSSVVLAGLGAAGLAGAALRRRMGKRKHESAAPRV